MTQAVKNKLELLSVEQVSVPANMTHFFQPLDLTVNKVAKNFMKKRVHILLFWCHTERATGWKGSGKY